MIFSYENSGCYEYIESDGWSKETFNIFGSVSRISWSRKECLRVQLYIEIDLKRAVFKFLESISVIIKFIIINLNNSFLKIKN